MSLSSTNKSFREVEYSTVAQCPFEIKDNSNDGDVDVDVVSRCISSMSGACIRLAPMERNNKRPNKPPRWVDTVHFHDLLQLPEQQQSPSVNDTENSKDKSAEEETKSAEEETKRSKNNSSFVLQWQGMAREGMAVALSPNKGYVLGETFQIVFGANGNTNTILQRKVKNDNTGNASAVSMAMQTPGRVCQERAWTSYWICFHQETLYAGVGDDPGQQCVGMLFNNHGGGCSSPSMIRFIGLGNAGIGDRDKPPMPLKVRNIRLLSSTSRQLPDSISSALVAISSQANNGGGGGGGMAIVHLGQEEIPAEQKALLEEYEKECTKARLRAEKFGLPYKEPPLTNSMAWSQVRRLKANPKQGFITGMDLADPAEIFKQEARKKRFGGGSTEAAVAGEEETKDDNDQQLTEDSKPRASAAGIDKVLPVTQAWENEECVRSQRADPPACLWKIPPTDEDNLNNADKKKTKKKNAFAMEPKDPPTYALEKVHVFSLDWAAFKQIRNNDLMSYFGVYSPTYIEWLGDFSANIHFQDQYSAARALQNLSQELPSPPPPPPLLGDDDSKSGVLNINDEEKDYGKELNDKEQDESKSIKGEGEEKQPEQMDLGRMGWRLGNTLVRKIANDRHGRRGTTARILLRMATSLDVLQERPSTWAKIPGFSTQHVLGPTKMSNRGHHGHSGDNSDSSSAGRNGKKSKSKKRERATAVDVALVEKKKGTGNKHQQSGQKKNDGGTQSLIDRGLRASRSGFSVEEMEAERARKKAKTSSQD